MNKSLSYAMFFCVLTGLLYWGAYAVIGTKDPGICFLLCVFAVHFVGEKPLKAYLEKEAAFMEKNQAEEVENKQNM